MDISPAMYKALKDKEIRNEKIIHSLSCKVESMQEIINEQEKTINKLNRIIDVLL